MFPEGKACYVVLHATAEGPIIGIIINSKHIRSSVLEILMLCVKNEKTNGIYIIEEKINIPIKTGSVNMNSGKLYLIESDCNVSRGFA